MSGARISMKVGPLTDGGVGLDRGDGLATAVELRVESATGGDAAAGATLRVAPHAAAVSPSIALAAASVASLHRLCDGLDTATCLRLNHVRFLSGGSVGAMSSRYVEAD